MGYLTRILHSLGWSCQIPGNGETGTGSVKNMYLISNKYQFHVASWIKTSFSAAASSLLLKIYILTHSQTTNLGLFQTERISEYYFTFDENGRTLSKRVENTEGKGDIDRYEQFLLFQQCFLKDT